MFDVRCACGCIIRRNDAKLAYAVVDGKKIRRNVCPKHSTYPEGKLLVRIYECVDCHDIFECNIKSIKTFRCKECQKIATAHSIKKSVSGIREDTKKIKNGLLSKLKHSELKIMKIISDPDNQFKCINFDMCGLCIKPYFECKMYKEYKGERNGITEK